MVTRKPNPSGMPPAARAAPAAPPPADQRYYALSLGYDTVVLPSLQSVPVGGESVDPRLRGLPPLQEACEDAAAGIREACVRLAAGSALRQDLERALGAVVGAGPGQCTPDQARSLALAAESAVGVADPRHPWFSIGHEVGLWGLRVWAQVLAPATQALKSAEPDAAPAVVRAVRRGYRPPPYAGVVRAVLKIPRGATADVPPLWELAAAAGQSTDVAKVRDAVARCGGLGPPARPRDEPEPEEEWLADYRDLLRLYGATGEWLKALARGHPPTPRWDRGLGELRVAGAVVKRVAVGRAIRVARVLDAFKTAGWPPRIAAPPGAAGRPALEGEAIHDTVKSLNDRLRWLRFHSDGEGKGIRWSLDGCVSGNDRPRR